MYPYSLAPASNDPYCQVITAAAAAPAKPSRANHAFRPVDYATFRRVLAKPENASANYVAAVGNSLWLADRHYRVIAKMTRPAIDHWSHVQPALYFLPQQPCRLPLRVQLPLLARASLRSPLSAWRRLRAAMAIRAARGTSQHAEPPAAQPQWTSMRLTA
ncbi:MAG: hypothetical protein HKO71_07105 [Pseudomonadales bacterium]|nr:hypothetical protein [Gammaproteobacteria bacterium]NNL57504.1 hypothetical protein [Pseudomonadales bacterium]